MTPRTSMKAAVLRATDRQTMSSMFGMARDLRRLGRYDEALATAQELARSWRSDAIRGCSSGLTSTPASAWRCAAAGSTTRPGIWRRTSTGAIWPWSETSTGRRCSPRPT